MAKYGFATLIDDYPTGYTFKADNTPLHLTHVDSFEVDLNTDELASNRALTVTKFLRDISCFRG